MDIENTINNEYERLLAIPFKNKGDFDYREVSEGDCSLIRPCYAAVKARSKEADPRPFCCQCNMLKNVPGSRKGKECIAIEGNLSGAIAIPLHYFKDNVIKEFFPVFGAVAIKDTCNLYAEDEYCSIFPNDIVCRRHWRKTCGMVFKYSGKYAVCTFGLNIIDCPGDELLSQDGFQVRSCCMKYHTDNFPSFEDFLCNATKRVLELMHQYDNIYKIMDLFNSNFTVYSGKSFKVVINNPNADPSVDGAIFCPGFPNAMIRGYLNGQPYNVNETLYDPMILPDETDEIYHKFDIMMQIQLQMDQDEQDGMDEEFEDDDIEMQ